MTSAWSWATGGVWGGRGAPVEAAQELRDTRAKRWRRAVTLTYAVAPYPADYEAVFSNVLFLHSDKTRVERAQRGGRQQLLENMYRGFKGLQYSGTLSSRQTFFDEQFSRQVDVVHGEKPRLLCSALCELLTLSGRRHGTLFVTDSALYFTTSTPSEQGGGGAAGKAGQRYEDKLENAMLNGRTSADDGGSSSSSSSTTSSNSDERCDNNNNNNNKIGNGEAKGNSRNASMRRALRDAIKSTRRRLLGGGGGGGGGGRDEQIRERVALTEVASILPSIALAVRPRCEADSDGQMTREAKDRASVAAYDMDYVCGVPCPSVLPTALQLFTATPRQIFQFVEVVSVYIAAPETTSRPAVGAEGDDRGGGDGGDAFTAAEYKLAVDLPVALDTLKLTVALMRIWRRRLAATDCPLLHPSVRYAARH